MFMQCEFTEGMKIPKGGFVQGGQLLVPLVDEDEDEDEAGAQLQRKLAGLNVSEITNAAAKIAPSSSCRGLGLLARRT